MTLKQECIDFISMMLPEEDDCDVYPMEIDVSMYICPATGDDVTYSGCEYCGTTRDECPYCQKLTVDVAFWDDDKDIQKKYIFGRCQPVNPIEGVCYIRNRKQLKREMQKLKDELDASEKWHSEFGRKYIEYMDYAREFAERIKADFQFGNGISLFESVNTEILPIVFHEGYSPNQNWGDTNIILGDFTSCGKQNMINIYHCLDDESSVKQRIRHELIHYFLSMADMQYKDETAIFHIMCEIYDAAPYKEMPENELKLYDKICKVLENLSLCLDNGLIDRETFNLYLSIFLLVGKINIPLETLDEVIGIMNRLSQSETDGDLLAS